MVHLTTYNSAVWSSLLEDLLILIIIYHLLEFIDFVT